MFIIVGSAGGGIPNQIKECMATWGKLKDYEIKCWDESNCSFDENEFVKKAYFEKRWAFVSDYYRLKALKEYGGIYLDTDVKVYKNFDNLLNHNFFIGYMFDCCMETAVFGSEKNSPIVNDLLHLYDITSFFDSDIKSLLWNYDKEKDKLLVNRFEPNNYYFTWYFIEKYPKFKRDNKLSILDDGVIVYPKEYFETGSLLGKHYSIHLNIGSWRTVTQNNGVYSKIKKMLLKSIFGEKIRIVVRKHRYKKMNRRNPFYGNIEIK